MCLILTSSEKANLANRYRAALRLFRSGLQQQQRQQILNLSKVKYIITRNPVVYIMAQNKTKIKKQNQKCYALMLSISTSISLRTIFT